MAAAFVQATNAGSNTGSTTITTAAFGSATTSGNAILVAIQHDVAAAGPPVLNSVTDSGGVNVYTLVGGTFTDPNDNAVRHAYCLNIVGGSSFTVTANFSHNAAFRRIVAFEVSGIALASALDKDSGGSSETGTNVTDANVAPSTNDQFIFASGGVTGGTASNTLSQGSGMTEPANATASAASNEMMCEYQIQTTATSIDVPFVRSASGLVSMRTSTYKSATVSFTWLEMFWSSLILPVKHRVREMVGY